MRNQTLEKRVIFISQKDTTGKLKDAPLGDWRRRGQSPTPSPDPVGTTPGGEVHRREGWTQTTVTMPPPNVNPGADQECSRQDQQKEDQPPKREPFIFPLPPTVVVVVVQMIKNTQCLSRVVPRMQLIMGTVSLWTRPPAGP